MAVAWIIILALVAGTAAPVHAGGGGGADAINGGSGDGSNGEQCADQMTVCVEALALPEVECSVVAPDTVTCDASTVNGADARSPLFLPGAMDWDGNAQATGACTGSVFHRGGGAWMGGPLEPDVTETRTRPLCSVTETLPDGGCLAVEVTSTTNARARSVVPFVVVTIEEVADSVTVVVSDEACV